VVKSEQGQLLIVNEVLTFHT